MHQKLSRRSFLRSLGALGAAGFASGTGLDRLMAAYPALAQSMNFTYWVDLGTNAGATMTTFNEMLAYQELERITGVRIEFQHPPMGQAPEQFNLLIASGMYPDIIEHNWLTASGGPARYLSDGVILRLNEEIEAHAPNLKRVLDEHPDWRKEVITDEGDLYCVPFLRGDNSLRVFQGPIMRRDWLDRLGLEVPTTMDEWLTTLVAFKEGDPNGDGTQVVAPFTSSLYGAPLNAFIAAHAFVGAWGIAVEFYQQDGVVKFGMQEPEFKEFLSTMASWYAAGVYDPDFITTDQALQDAKVTSNQLGAFVQNTGGGIGKYLGLMAGQNPEFDLVAVPYPVLTKGDKPLFGQIDRTFPGTGAAISSACSSVEEAVKWLDFAFSEEGHMLFNFGVEGVSYTLEDGYPAYTEAVTNADLPLAQSMARYFRSNFSGPFVQDRRYMEQYAALPQQQESLQVWTEPSNEMVMPPVTPTQEESREFASIINDIRTLRDETIVRIIIGQASVSDWDQTLGQMRQIGLDRAIAIQQGALERFNAR